MTILESAIQTVYKWLTAFSVDIVAIELILCAPMRKRKGFGFRLLLFIPFIVTSMIYRSVTGNSFYMLPCFFIGWFAYIFSAMVLLSAILLWFCFDENFLQLLFYAVAAHVIQNLIYMERMILDIVLLQSVTGTAYYLISRLIVVSSAFSICYMLRKQMKKHPFELENRVLIAFSTAAALIVSLLHYWVYAFHYASLATYCYQLLCCCLLLVIQFDIFNTSGLRVADISNHELLGISGKITWSGVANNGSPLQTGVYIFYAEIYHPEGTVKRFKKAFLIR